MKADLVSIRNVFQKHIYVYSLTFNGVQSFDTTLKRRHLIFSMHKIKYDIVKCKCTKSSRVQI